MLTWINLSAIERFTKIGNACLSICASVFNILEINCTNQSKTILCLISLPQSYINDTLLFITFIFYVIYNCMNIILIPSVYRRIKLTFEFFVFTEFCSDKQNAFAKFHWNLDT